MGDFLAAYLVIGGLTGFLGVLGSTIKNQPFTVEVICVLVLAWPLVWPVAMWEYIQRRRERRDG